MRALLVCLPATGHVLPLVPLAHALRDAGHEVAFATGPDIAWDVEGAGFRLLPAGMSRAEWSDVVAAADLPGEIALFGPGIFAGPLARRLADDLPVTLADWPADVVVHEDTAVGAAVAAERLGLPHARLMILAAGPGHPLYSRIDGPIAALRERHGLAPGSADSTLHRHLVLCPFPPSLLLPGQAVPATLHHFRSPLPGATTGGPLPEWVDDLGRGDRRVVYATLGTLFNGPANDDLFDAFLAALRDEDVDVLLTVGMNRDPADFGPQPPHVRVARFVPLAAVLPRCGVVLSHGGSGTVAAALAHGLPQVVVPIFADQPENAARVAALGAGLRVDLGDVGPSSIRSAVRAALDDPAYRQRAELVRDEIAALPGPEHAVALLERLVPVT